MAQQKVDDLLDALLFMTPFETNTWSANLLETCKDVGIIDALKPLLPSPAPTNDSLPSFEAYIRSDTACQQSLKNLILGSLGQNFRQISASYGFGDATDPVFKAFMITDSELLTVSSDGQIC
jgi:hypothetical protein